MSVALTYCNSLKPTVYKIGYLGIGDFLPTHIYYEVWKQMLRRCYDLKNQQAHHPSYSKCSVHESWLNYQNFGKFCIDNKYSKELFIDKDILLKGNKTYGPDTCCFVNRHLNNLFTKSNVIRGKLPIGVRLNGFNYEARCGFVDLNGKKSRKLLGTYKTPEEAFKVYKKAKEEYIKEMADKYKSEISEKVYNALYSYVVEITD